MNTYTEVTKFPSKSSAGKFYTVKRDQNGNLSCDCMAWRFKKPNQERDCKHIAAFILQSFAPKHIKDHTENSLRRITSDLEKRYAQAKRASKLEIPAVQEPELIAPMLASSGSPEDLDNKPGFAVGKKYDGFREIMYIDSVGKVTLRSRSGADHSANVPHLTGELVPELANTILDGEGIAPSESHGETKTIFGSDPDVAIEAQTRIGKAKYMAFDIMRANGYDTTNLPLKQRVFFLSTAIFHLNKIGISVYQEQLFEKEQLQHFHDLIAAGGEGVMLKDLNAPYEPGKRSNGWIKVKKVNSWDAVITGFTEGKGKYVGVVGAITYGFWQDGKVVEAGKSSGMTNAERIMFAANPKSFIGKVVEIEGQEIGTNGAIRFPRFLRVRNDKVASQCVLDITEN